MFTYCKYRCHHVPARGDENNYKIYECYEKHHL